MTDKKVLQFHSNAVSDGDLLVTEVSGVEALSTLYAFEISLVCKQGTLDLDALLEQAAYLGIKRGLQLGGTLGLGKVTLKRHGMLSCVEQREKRGQWVHYQATLVPRLWRLTQTWQSRIFLDQSIPDILEEVLKSSGLTPNDYELRLVGDYGSRSYVVQYEETDFDFISRWLEHYGIFYFFEQDEDGDKVIFADSSSAYVPIQGGAALSYKPQTVQGATGAEAWFAEEVVSAFACRQQPVPGKVVLKDYNWRKPSDDLQVSQDVSEQGVGQLYQLNNHYRSQQAGKALATARAQGYLCRQKQFAGESDCRAMLVGVTFQLNQHYRYDTNRTYVLTEVRHHATQDVELASSGSVGATYSNSFTAIPAELNFRPPCTTPWPSINGVIPATIDGSGDGSYAEIDDRGRYKVILPFDLSGRSGGKASYYIRMATPYAGSNHGQHFPLHKGTEVMLVHVDGDPDRPIIAAAVPNSETPSLVTSSNQTQSLIHTAGGNMIHIEDAEGRQRIKFHSPGSKTTFQIGSGLD
ncbi:type VI secretion system tip protein VgrG [Acidimicrobium ferrooxidans]|nr:type VI secretion system tip protein VgrG [Acidimicrobium ferrooxidans]